MVKQVTDRVDPHDGDAAEARSRRVKSVDHAVDVLQALGKRRDGASLADLARSTKMSKAATYHLLATLETRRFVARDPDTALYRLDWGLYELGSTVVNGVELTRVARHFLDGLASETSEFVLLAIVDEDSVLYLDRGDAPSPFRVTANTGRRFPLHSTASGKVLLAFSTDQAMYERVLHGDLPKMTVATITDPEILRKELDQTRRRGFATCWQEGEVGLCSVAVPIHDHQGRITAALTIIGMSTRLNADTVGQHLLPLRAAARAIENRLGYPPSAARARSTR